MGLSLSAELACDEAVSRVSHQVVCCALASPGNVVAKCRGGRRLLLSARKLETVLSCTRYIMLVLSNSQSKSVCKNSLFPRLYACNN